MKPAGLSYYHSTIQRPTPDWAFIVLVYINISKGIRCFFMKFHKTLKKTNQTKNPNQAKTKNQHPKQKPKN